MTTRVGFIRGINVGGRAIVPMAGLRAALTERGLQNARTYIQSGNVVYEPPASAGDSAAALRSEGRMIAAAIENMHGFTPAVMVLTVQTVAAHLAASPYPDADPAKAFMVFADGDWATLGDLDPYASNGEQWRLIDGVMHLHCPDGIGRSKLGARLATTAKTPTTTRNLRTVAKLLELAG